MQGVDALDGYQHSIDASTGSARWSCQPVVISVPPSLHRLAASGASYVRAALGPSDVTRRAGLPVTSPLRTAFDASRLAPDLMEAVAVLDACFFHGLVRPSEFQAYSAERRPVVGAGLVREAIPLADPTARNPWESRLRLFCTVGLGLPRPQANPPVFDLGGALLGLPDLLFEEAGCVVEFDGQDHRERRQHRADNIREERLEACGLVVVRVDSLDLLYHRAELAMRLRTAYERGLERNRDLDQWTLAEPQWWREQADRRPDLPPRDLSWLAEQAYAEGRNRSVADGRF